MLEDHSQWRRTSVAIVLPKLSRFRPSIGANADAPPALSVELCRSDARYQAGQPLRAYWQIGSTTVREITGLEASVLWFTEGKGDEDLHVHHFVRWNDAQLQQLDLSQRQSIDCFLPLSPITYNGTLIRICWCVRVRLFRSLGRECVTQQPFQMLGVTVPAMVDAVSSRS